MGTSSKRSSIYFELEFDVHDDKHGADMYIDFSARLTPDEVHDLFTWLVEREAALVLVTHVVGNFGTRIGVRNLTEEHIVELVDYLDESYVARDTVRNAVRAYLLLAMGKLIVRKATVTLGIIPNRFTRHVRRNDEP